MIGGAQSGHRPFGFTMIEVLVTLTIFSLVLSSLLLAMRTGIDTAHTLRRHARERAVIDGVRDQFGRDVRHITVIGMERRPLVEENAAQGGEVLRITGVTPWPAVAGERGGVWSRTEYAPVVRDDRSVDLVRRRQAFVNEGRLGEAESSVLVRDIAHVGFSYVRDDEVVGRWDRETALPDAVVITIERDGKASFRHTAAVPLSRLARAVE